MRVRPALVAAPLFATALASTAIAGEPIALGNRLELMVDRFLVERMDKVRFAPAQPREREIVFRYDQPWEEANGMVSVLKDGNTYRMYYRGGRPGTLHKPVELTCYAESRDGIHWKRPVLGLHEFEGSRLNNIIMPPGDPRRIAHNFAPFLDDRPGIPADQRYKAVGGRNPDFGGAAEGTSTLPRDKGGLYRFVSADGIHWRQFSDEPLFNGYALDTLNVLEWIPAEQVYAIYLRTWTEGGTPDHPRFGGIRTISRSVSQDFVHWSKPVPMTFGDTPAENLYTNGTHPYFRAPHILIALPFRFLPGRQILSEDELKAFGVRKSQWVGMSDTVFMTSRGGTRYDRTIMESYIRPGLDRRNWHARNNKAAKGVVQTGDDEMSLYVITHNTLLSSRVTRYTLPLDRFVSINADYAGGSFGTKAVTFAGDRLVINYSTSAAGNIRVEIQDDAGRPLPEFSAADCDEIVGDEIERTVTWHGSASLGTLAGQPIRLRFTMKDADIYAIRFR